MPRNYLHRVVAIGASNRRFEGVEDLESLDVTGTGFFYDYPANETTKDGRPWFRRWLVTCEHEIRKARDGGNRWVLVRMNYRVGLGITVVSLSVNPEADRFWTFHPTADVAVIQGSWRVDNAVKIQYGKFTSGKDALTKQECKNRGLFEGDEVFLLGFPIGWSPGSQDYPIVRNGVLAQLQGWLNGDHATFLVDGSGFPGNSGGPVVTKPQLMTFDDSGRFESAYLVGMVAERRFSDIETNVASTVENTYLEETADLIEVVSVDDIEDTIDLAMKAEERYAAE